MSSTTSSLQQAPLLTADGIPLKVSLERSLRQNRLRAMMLVAPTLLFLIILFVIPIGEMLFKSVDDTLINKVLPKTFVAFDEWDKQSDPPEALFAAIYEDLNAASKIQRVKIIFQAGMQMVRQLEFALFDFRMHLEYDPQQGGRIQQILDEVRAEVAPIKKPRVRASAASQARSPTRWKPNIE